ncbi:hypothetical protein Tco_0994697 [Tanacetum coccineum]
MKKIIIVIHHEGTFYDPLIYNDIDFDVVKNVDLSNCNHKRMLKIIKECCVFHVHGMYFYAPKQDIAEGITASEEVVDVELDGEIEMEDISD